jgi:hypothetical protein
VVDRDGPLDVGRASALGAGLAEALQAIHAVDLVHRDLKPSNVLMAPDGPRVIDFGIVRVTDVGTALTGSGMRLGTIGYLSPEQLYGQPVTPASDVFALGVLLVYATAGHLPFPGTTDVAVARRMDRAPDLSGVPGPLRGVLRRCLEIDPTARPTVAELLAVFGGLARGGAPSGRADAPAARYRPTRVDPGPGGEVRHPGRPDAGPARPEPEARGGDPGRPPRQWAASAAPRPIIDRAVDDAVLERRATPDELADLRASPAPLPPAGRAGLGRMVLAVLLLAAVTVGELRWIGGMSSLMVAIGGGVATILGTVALPITSGTSGTKAFEDDVGAFVTMVGLTIGYGVCAGLLVSQRTDFVWWGVGLVAVGAAVVLGFAGVLPAAVLEESRSGPLPAANALAMASGVLLVVVLAWFAGSPGWLAFVGAAALQAILGVVLCRLVSVQGGRPSGTDPADDLGDLPDVPA